MKVVLIGDSIRGGYQDLVRHKMGDRAEVWSPQENCGHSLMHRENLERWYLEQKTDVIHFNCGIWDSGVMADGARRFTLSAYLRNLKLIVRRLKWETKARLIWATTTPMLTPRDATPKENCRVDPAVVRYNEGATRLMQGSGIEVNDLFRVVMDTGVFRCLSDDKVHMAPYGYEVLSDAVVRRILG